MWCWWCWQQSSELWTQNRIWSWDGWCKRGTRTKCRGSWDSVQNIYECQHGPVRGWHRTRSSRQMMGRLGCGEKEVALSREITIDSEVKVWPPSDITPSHLKCLYVCKFTSNRIHLPQILSPLSTLHCKTHKLSCPCFIAIWHISDIFPFKLAVRNSYKFERCEGGSIFRRIQTLKGGHLQREWQMRVEGKGRTSKRIANGRETTLYYFSIFPWSPLLVILLLTGTYHQHNGML